MDTCTKCGAALGVGRFCLNCGHPIGAPVAETTVRTARVPRERHEAAAEQARRLQAADAAPSTEPAAEGSPATAPGTAPVVRDTDDGWFLPGARTADEPARLNWGAWVLAALALVAAVLLALSILEDRAGTSAADPAASSPAGEDEGGEKGGEKSSEKSGGDDAEASGPAVDVTGGATVAVPATAPPTTDLDGALVPYDAERMVDGDRTTAWRMPGDGTGAEITLTLAEPAQVTRVGLVNGYAKQVAGVDWYPNNRRVLAVRWSFEDGSSVEQTLVERPRLQWLDVPGATGSTVTLTLLAVSAPGTGELGRDYTAISTVAVRGRPAG